MARQKLPPAWDWKARELKDWNTDTFLAYMKDLHKEVFGTPYVTNNLMAEKRNIKWLFTNYGKQETKAFIDLCFTNYKPGPRYSGVSFMFCFSYLRAKYLSQAIAQVQKQNEREARKEEQQKALSDKEINQVIDLF
jgi:hypothetical protein